MKSLIVITLAALLSACVTQPKIEYVTKYQLVLPDSTMVKDCKVTKPTLNREKYIYSLYPEKEKMLYELTNSLLADIAICNAQWEELRKWSIQQETVYKTK